MTDPLARTGFLMAAMNSGTDSGVGLGSRESDRIGDALPGPLALAEVIRDAAGVVVDFGYVYVNPAVELRPPPGRLVGRTVGETVPPELLSETLEWYSRALSAADPVLVRMSYRADDGQVIGVSVQASGLDEGRITVSWRDISREEQAEEEARQWSEIFDRATWGVALVSGGRIPDLNRAYAAMHGYSEGKLIGAPAEQMFGEASRAPVPERSSAPVFRVARHCRLSMSARTGLRSRSGWTWRSPLTRPVGRAIGSCRCRTSLRACGPRGSSLRRKRG
jgi:PAS domain-containing protein